MTSPDLAKLIERLRDTHPRDSGYAENANEAAEALSRLSGEREADAKRIAELETAVVEAVKATSNSFEAYCEIKSRAETAERQRDEAIERAAEVVCAVICSMEWPPSDGDALIDMLQSAIRALKPGT